MKRVFNVFLVIFLVIPKLLFAQKIDSLSKFIIRTGDTLVVYGNNIQSIRIKSFPDSVDIQQFIAKRPNLLDTGFVFIIPQNFRNDIYSLRAQGYNNRWSRPKLMRTYNFNPTKIYKAAWGENYVGELNVNNFPKNIIYINGGEAFVYAIDLNGVPYGIGNNFNNQLNFPAGLKDVVDIRGGWYHGLALTKDGVVFAFGDTTFKETFVPNNLLDSVVYISTGGFYSACITETGRVVVWGGENNFSLYADTVDFGQRNVPNNLGYIEQVAPRGSHVLALNSNGQVRAWGLNDKGQATISPTLSAVTQISGGWKHSLAITKPFGKVIPWGEPTFLALDTPANLNQVIKIDGGDWHGLALKSDGTIAQWGGNYNSFIYNNLNRKPTLKNVVDIAAGDYASYALYRIIDTIFVTANIPGAGNFLPIIIADSTDSVTVSFNPNIKYKLDSIILNDTLLIKDSLTSFTFYKITSNQKINLFFSLAFDTIFVSENIVGAGIYDSQTIANSGDTIAVFYKPSSLKYKLDSILLNDTLLIKDSLTSFTFYKITSNQKINLFFSLAFDTIFVSENIVGAGIYDSQTIANAGDTIAVFYKPSSLKYKLDSILLNDTLLIKDSLKSYTFYKITSNQKIKLFFSLGFDTIFVSENIVGAGIYDSQTIANAGDTIVVFYKPSSLKYKLDSILLNDTLLIKDSLTSFTFYKITSNQKIKLFFSLVLDTIFISENIVGAGIYNSQTIAIIGDTIAVFYKPSSLKYKLDSILINDMMYEYDSLERFTFYNITSNQKIKLFFSVIFDSIFISTNIPSGINFISLYKVVRTDSIRIMYHTLYNYRIDSIIINDTLFNKDSLSNYTFKNIVGNQKLRLIISRIYTPPVIKIQLDTIPKFYCANTSTNIIVRLMIKVQATADSNTYLNSKLVRYQWYVSNKPDTLLGKPIAGAQGLLYSFDTTLFLLPLNINFGIPLDSEAYYYVSFENNYDTQKLYSNFSGLIVFKNIIANTIKIDTFNKVSPRQSSEAVKISLTGASYYFISPALYAFPSIAVSDQYIYLKPTESTLFKIIGIDEYGCVLDDSLFVPVDSFFDIDIYPTKVITPNNDGINDYWVIHNILYYPNNKIVIYNRMNQVVKSFVNFTPFTRWNGNSTFDNILSNGQYFYFIECYDINNRIIKSKKGDFIIRRN